jgi:hypothetical protein
VAVVVVVLLELVKVLLEAVAVAVFTPSLLLLTYL